MLIIGSEHQYEVVFYGQMYRKKEANAKCKVGLNEGRFNLDQSHKLVCKPKVDFVANLRDKAHCNMLEAVSMYHICLGLTILWSQRTTINSIFGNLFKKKTMTRVLLEVRSS